MFLIIIFVYKMNKNEKLTRQLKIVNQIFLTTAFFCRAFDSNQEAAFQNFEIGDFEKSTCPLAPINHLLTLFISFRKPKSSLETAVNHLKHISTNISESYYSSTWESSLVIVARWWVYFVLYVYVYAYPIDFVFWQILKSLDNSMIFVFGLLWDLLLKALISVCDYIEIK